MFPYNCTEQIISKAFIGLALKNQQGYKSEPFEITFNEAIQLLRQRQTSDGNFNYWPNNSTQLINPFVTIYATDFLTEAKIRKYNVPQDLFNNAIDYLKTYASSNPSDVTDARLHAYAIYILTRNDIVTTDYLANLQEYYQQTKNTTWVTDISSVFLAATYKMLQNNEIASKLISHYRLGAIVENNNNLDDSQVMDALYINVLASYFPERLHNLTSATLMSLVDKLSNNNVNSLTIAVSAMALNNFTDILKSNIRNDNLSILEIDKDKHSTLLTSGVFNVEAKQISFITKNNNSYFYQVTRAGFDKNLPNDEIKSGLEIYREYQNQQGALVTLTNLADELIVHIRLRSLNKHNINNIAIVDLLPAGFELVPNSVTPQEYTIDGLNYYDMRDDRIIFYVTATLNSQEFTYRIRAINKGNFTVAPIFATGIYNPDIIASQKGGLMQVK